MYVNDRKQYMAVDGTFSTTGMVDSDILQGIEFRSIIIYAPLVLFKKVGGACSNRRNTFVTLGSCNPPLYQALDSLGSRDKNLAASAAIKVNDKNKFIVCNFPFIKNKIEKCYLRRLFSVPFQLEFSKAKKERSRGP